jgi:Cu/Ag efflux pump CusA
MRKITVTLTMITTPSKLAKKYGVTVAEIKKQLSKGIKVEHEHTRNKLVAEKIALDHLNENLNYYKKLKL